VYLFSLSVVEAFKFSFVLEIGRTTYLTKMVKNIAQAIKDAFKRTLPLNTETNNRKRQSSDDDNNVSDETDQPSSPQPGPSGLQQQRPKVARVQTESLQNNETKNDLFLEKTPLYENDHIKIYVVKDYLKRQKIFRLDDHLYSVKVEIKDGHPPLLTSLLDVLRNAFEFMINSLKNFYQENDRNIMYMTIYQDSMQSALNSGGFELHGNQPQNMVNYALNMLNRFLNSNATLKLDDSFCVYFKVLSVQHVNYAFHRRGPLMVVGCDDNSPIAPGIWEINSNLQEEHELVNKCLLTHVVLGKLQCEARATNNSYALALLLSLCKQNTKSYRKQCYTKKYRSQKSEEKIKQSQQKALKMLNKKVQELIAECKLNSSGPYNVHEVLPKICNFYNIQVHIICGLQTKKASLLSFPPNFDDTKFQIVLQKTSDQHVNLISNLKTFFGHNNKRVCFECSKTFAPRYRHFCSQKKVCYACRRFYRTKETELANDKFFDYCDAQIEENFLTVPSICTLCNMVLTTKSCEETHKTLCGKEQTSKGRLGFYCNLCRKHFRHGFTSSEDAQKNHVCSPNLVRCYNCKFLKEENHLCAIKKQSATNVTPILAFFAFSFKALMQCKSCLTIRETFKQEHKLTWPELYQHKDFASLVCDNHQSFNNCNVEPNLAVIFKEIKRGVFKQFIVTEDSLSNKVIVEDGFSFNYLPSHVEEFEILTEYKYQCDGLLKTLNKLKLLQNKTLVQNFLLLITQPEWQNTTFLSLNASNSTNLAVLKGFIELDVMPYVIENGNKVNLISVDFLNLRFLNASAYLSGTLEEIHEQYDLEKDVPLHYFPYM
jgi:hypothetical protein